MKRKALSVLSVLILVLVLVLGACSSGNATEVTNGLYYSKNESYDMSAEMEGLAPMATVEATTAAPSYEPGYDKVLNDSAGGSDSTPTTTSEKIIYNANVTLETQAYEDTVKGLKELLTSLGGYVQNESQSGSSYGRTQSRYGVFTLRIPQEHFHTMMDGVAGLGNVPFSETSQQNVTMTYVDTEARLKSLRTQEERLLGMLAKSETVDEMLIIESHLQEVRYQIESATATLRNIDRQVSYSTINLTVREVSEYSTAAPQVQSYWEQVWGDLQDAFEGIGDFFKDLLRFVIVMSPVGLIVLAVLVPVLLIGKRSLKKRRDRRREKLPEDPETKEE